VPRGTTVFAAVAPGNVRSLRMFLRHGFTPIGSEVVIRPARGSGIGA
jgi:RimJ/RimL family protein N-acetyltransferase